MTRSYEDVASEYYDRARHPTAANFRDASTILVKEWLAAVLPADGLVVEVGAGKSLLAEQLHERGLPMSDLLVTDASAEMLAYSSQWERCGAQLQVADAASLPVPDGCVSLLVSVLGDPYNMPEFWHEVARVLNANGTCLFTTPSHGWSEAFRSQAGEPQACAEFELRGKRIRVPSLIFTVDEQARMVGAAGLRVVEVRSVPLDALGEAAVSRKLTGPLVGDDSVVTGYRVAR